MPVTLACASVCSPTNFELILNKSAQLHSISFLIAADPITVMEQWRLADIKNPQFLSLGYIHYWLSFFFSSQFILDPHPEWPLNFAAIADGEADRVIEYELGISIAFGFIFRQVMAPYITANFGFSMKATYRECPRYAFSSKSWCFEYMLAYSKHSIWLSR